MKKGDLLIAAGIAIAGIALYTTRKPITKIVKNMTRPKFIETFADNVRNAAAGTGLFPSLFMAQAILESADSKGVPGNSTLARVHNNYFGIKADKSWAGEKVTMKTREVINGKSVMVDEPFRKYATPADSFRDRVKFLKQNKRYTNAGVFSAKSPAAQAEALQRAGYATDPNYAKTLTNLISKYNLTSLDS